MNNFLPILRREMSSDLSVDKGVLSCIPSGGRALERLKELSRKIREK
jgi:hypothetical protein